MTDETAARRSLIAGFGATAAAIVVGAKAAAAQAPATGFQPARHEQDMWFNTVPGKHRTFIDCASVGSAGAGSKYGKAIGDVVQFSDPKTKQAATKNLLNASDYGQALSNGGVTIASVVQRGTHFAVCGMAANMIAGRVAAEIKADSQEVYKDGYTLLTAV